MFDAQKALLQDSRGALRRMGLLRIPRMWICEGHELQRDARGTLFRNPETAFRESLKLKAAVVTLTASGSHPEHAEESTLF